MSFTINWEEMEDMEDRDEYWGTLLIWADWIEEEGEPEIAEGIRIVCEGRRRPLTANNEELGKHWWWSCRSSPRSPCSIPQRVYQFLEGELHTQSPENYRNYSTREKAFLDLAKALLKYERSEDS